MKKNFCIILLCVFFILAGCSKKQDERNSSIYDGPVYTRHSEDISLISNFNPYDMSYCNEGILYAVLDESGDGNLDEYAVSSSVYFHDFIKEETERLVCKLDDAFIMSFLSNAVGNEITHFVMWQDEGIHIFAYSTDGGLKSDILLDDALNGEVSNGRLMAIKDGLFLIAVNDGILLIDNIGNAAGKVKVEGYVSDIVCDSLGNCYTVYEKNQSNKTSYYISRIDFLNSKLVDEQVIPGGAFKVFASDSDKLLAVSDDKMIAFSFDGDDYLEIMDFNIQAIISSNIKYVTDNNDVFTMIIFDENMPMSGLHLVSFGAREDAPIKNNAEKKLTTEDGRNIIYVAVPTGYKEQIEFHAKQYNQTSENFVEIERFDESVEEYLGKGNRPDVIMLEDSAEAETVYKKDILADFTPFMAEQDKYSIDDILPEVWNMLGDGEAIYSFAGRFKLLLRASNGDEYNDGKGSTTNEYFDWYSQFMKNEQIPGLGDIETVIYATVIEYYNEEMAECFFASDVFKALALSYKQLRTEHNGELPRVIGDDLGYVVEGIARGPKWYDGLGLCSYLANPDCRLEGIPTSTGEEIVLSSIEYPMGILKTSEHKEEAFDFIMYYSALSEYLEVGNSSSDYGKSYLTGAPFSVFKKVLNEELYETESPYYAERGAQAGSFDFYYFTEEQKSQLSNLISISRPETAIQKIVYEIVSEELESYVQSDKTLEETCKIIQSRVKTLLEERK